MLFLNETWDRSQMLQPFFGLQKQRMSQCAMAEIYSYVCFVRCYVPEDDARYQWWYPCNDVCHYPKLICTRNAWIQYSPASFANYAVASGLCFDRNIAKSRRSPEGRSRMERVNGIEPSSPGWKPGVIAIIRHPRDDEYRQVLPILKSSFILFQSRFFLITDFSFSSVSFFQGWQVRIRRRIK